MNHHSIIFVVLLSFTTSSAFQTFQCVQKIEIPSSFKGDKVEKLVAYAKSLFPTYKDFLEAKKKNDHNYEVFTYAIVSLAGFDGTYKTSCYTPNCCFKARSLPEEGANSPLIFGCSTPKYGCNVDNKKVMIACTENFCNKEGNSEPTSKMSDETFMLHAENGQKLTDAVNKTLFFDSVYNG